MRGIIYFRGARIFITMLLALAAASCGDGSTLDNSLVPGQTDFTNTEPGSSGRNYAGAEGGDLGSSKGTSPTAPPGNSPPQGRTGEVEEADIYKVDKNRLFYLNTYRGFLVYDIADPKNPKALSRLGVYGYPIEMFIKDNTVYALIKDALYLTQVNGKLEFKRHNVSQLVSIDISDIKNPKVLKTVDIVGQLREGVSRKIDDTIYVVSYHNKYYYYGWNYSGQQGQQKEQAWVYSFNVADPKNLKLVEKLKVFEGGGYSSSTSTSSQSRYFNKVTISATSNALMVAENWRVYGSVRGSKYNCGSYVSMQQAIVSIIDISDPKGKIRLHTKLETYGELGDQFKQTYIYDKVSKKATYLGIFARREWNSSNCSGTSLIKNTVESWDVTDGSKPVKQNEIYIGKPNETVRGSVFDSERSVAFAITARQVDPLYAIDYSDPKNLKIVSSVDGLSGDMNVFRFIGDKKFLIAIGRDNSGHCTGFGTGWESTKVAVSIIDAQNINDVKLVQRQCVAVQNASWVSSAVNTDLDQAHKMIGMHSDGTVNVITVPVYYYKKSTQGGWWWYGYETAVGMMTWDLSLYDPKKSYTEQKVLKNYGTVIHPKGQVRRSIVFTHKSANRRMMINLSNTHVSMVDIENLDKPVSTAMIEVAPYQDQLFKFGDYMVEHIRSGAYEPYSWYSSNQYASEFRVKKIGTSSLENTPAVASFMVGQVERVLKYKDKLVLFKRAYDPSKKSGYYYGSYKTEVLVYDFKNPTKPVQVGATQTALPILPYYRFYCGSRGYWGGYWFDSYYGYNYGVGAWTMTDRGVTFLVYHYTGAPSYNYERRMAFLNLTNPADPKVDSVLMTTDSKYAFYGLVADPGDSQSFYLSYKVRVGQTPGSPILYHYKYYAQRWTFDGKQWLQVEDINLPGILVKAWSKNSGTQFLTQDYTYNKQVQNKYTYWAASARLNLLQRINYYGKPLAQLQDYYGFNSMYLRDLVMEGEKLYVNARYNGYYYGYSSPTSTTSYDKYSDHLMIFDTSSYKLNKTYGATTATYNMQLMGAFGDKLFISLPYDGVLVVNTKDPAKPEGAQFMRTLGYATHLEFVGKKAYVASGYFGTYQMDL